MGPIGGGSWGRVAEGEGGLLQSMAKDGDGSGL
jgi:hypothetical protein